MVLVLILLITQNSILVNMLLRVLSTTNQWLAGEGKIQRKEERGKIIAKLVNFFTN